MVRKLDHDEIFNLLKRLETHCADVRRVLKLQAEKEAMRKEAAARVTMNVEAYSRIAVWREIGREIWGSLRLGGYFDYDRAIYLKLAQIIALTSSLKYRYGILKNARTVIEGRSGIGKTTYAMLSLYGAFRILGLDRDSSWSLAISLTFMDSVDFAEFMYKAIKNEVYIPAIILDEAGLALSKYWIWGSRELKRAMASLLEVFDQIKDWTGVLILTTPTLENVAKRLRDICDYRIQGDEFPTCDEDVVELYTVWVIKRRVLHFYEVYSYPHRSVIKRAKLEEEPIDVDVMPSTIKLPEQYWKIHTGERRERALERLSLYLKTIEMIQRKEEEEWIKTAENAPEVEENVEESGEE